MSKNEIKLPALMPEAPAFFKPFFLTMKLAPIKRLEDNARTSPLILSEDMPLYGSVQLREAASAAADTPSAAISSKQPNKP